MEGEGARVMMKERMMVLRWRRLVQDPLLLEGRTVATPEVVVAVDQDQLRPFAVSPSPSDEDRLSGPSG